MVETNGGRSDREYMCLMPRETRPETSGRKVTQRKGLRMQKMMKGRKNKENYSSQFEGEALTPI